MHTILEKENKWNKTNQWENELEQLHAIIRKTPLIETTKWGGPVYTYKNKNVVGIGGFKSYFGIWFYNGVFLKDEKKLLINANEENTKSLRQMRFNSANEIDEKLILNYIKEAIETMETWGFKYITVAFVWEKKTKTGKTVANLGAWTMKNYELCLFGTKGTMLKYKKVNNIYQKVEAERTIHSRKPRQVRTNIETLFGDLPRIELFAREKTEGWDVWGNEVVSDIEL